MRDAPYSSSRNSFHLMRFVLALLVIICHAHTLRLLSTPLDRFTGGQLNEGALAVDGFLVISGFLICQSGVRNRNVLVFLRNRALRIIPAFLVALAFSALVIGGLAYDGSYAEYLRLGSGGPITWMRNWGSLNVQGERLGVTGVFATNSTQSLNVSLWTLKHEISLYLLMALLIVTTLNRKRPTYIVLFAFFLVLHVLLNGFGLYAWRAADVRWWVLSVRNYPRFVETGLYFFAGTLLYCYRDRVPRRWYLAVIALLALVLGTLLGFAEIVYIAALPYLIVYLAGSPVCSGFERVGDLSFGMYVYSYPVQQLLYHIQPQMAPWANVLLTLLMVLPLSAASWRVIEEPVLRLKTPGQKASRKA